MAQFLKREDYKYVVINAISLITAGVATAYIASKYIASEAATQAAEKTIAKTMGARANTVSPKQEVQTEKVYSMATKPKLALEIITSEYNPDIDNYEPVLGHRFYGDSEKDLYALIESHKKTDKFFKASFEGIFMWRGSEILLRNEVIGPVNVQ